MSVQTARNVGIIVLIALAVAFLPRGGQAADLVGRTLNAVFIVVTALIVGMLYRQYRGEIFGLGDQWRFALYAAVGLAIVTVSITGQLWATLGGDPDLDRRHRRVLVHAVRHLAALPLLRLSSPRRRRPGSRCWSPRIAWRALTRPIARAEGAARLS